MKQPLRRRLFGRLYKVARVSPRRLSYERHKTAARKHILALVTEYATQHGFTLKRIAIRDTRRRWGSCSALGHLNFSYKLLFLPLCQARYIVVHELCHLRELNHSERFWHEVAALMPDYETRVSILRHFERTHGTSKEALIAWQRAHDAAPCAHCQADVAAAVGEVLLP
jgi:predicted metal-dependent hydrolase